MRQNVVEAVLETNNANTPRIKPLMLPWRSLLAIEWATKLCNTEHPKKNKRKVRGRRRRGRESRRREELGRLRRSADGDDADNDYLVIGIFRSGIQRI